MVTYAKKDGFFFCSLFVSRLADQILLFLVPLVVYQITGSLSWSGFAFFFESLPRFLFFPYCGLLCDRISSFKLLHLSQLLRVLVCVLGVLGYFLFAHIFWLVLISAVAGILTTQGLMAREVMLVQSFQSYRYEKIISYAQISDQAGMVLGPVVAAFLLKLIDWEVVVIIAGVLFLFSDVAVYAWKKISDPYLPLPTKGKHSIVSQFKLAFSHVLRLPGLKETIALAFSVNFIMGVTLATSAAIVTGAQGHDEIYYGFLQAGAAFVTVIVLLFIAHVKVDVNILGILSYAALSVGGFMTSFIADSTIYLFGFLMIIGFDKMFSVYIRSLRKKIIPAEDFGKTTGLVVLLNNISQPIAGLIVGVVAITSDAGGVILWMSVFMTSVGVYLFIIRGRKTLNIL